MDEYRAFVPFRHLRPNTHVKTDSTLQSDFHLSPLRHKNGGVLGTYPNPSSHGANSDGIHPLLTDVKYKPAFLNRMRTDL